ncbi:uncharacterized protein LOC134756019 [Cydia strobilella]|uniref:uncharacterized protein LOC134756019 n=1 Tax=Cydia strobilella TaxID=1100964 RepID=UPI0030064B1F
MAALFCFTIWMLVSSSQSISSKLDFDETGESSSSVMTNASQPNDEDVEVKHTIVVSTKLKNNNRRGLHSSSDGDLGALTYNIGRTANKQEDSSEVPILYGLQSVETTQLRTPDSRFKNRVYPDSVFINRNIRDDYDHYPNSATNPMAWKPSNFFNNINWRNPDSENQVYNPRPNPGTVKFHRKITDDGMKEFYCRKCQEFSRGLNPVQSPKGCVQGRNAWIYETTTPKMKIDGKLAKLN